MTLGVLVAYVCIVNLLVRCRYRWVRGLGGVVGVVGTLVCFNAAFHII